MDQHFQLVEKSFYIDTTQNNITQQTRSFISLKSFDLMEMPIYQKLLASMLGNEYCLDIFECNQLLMCGQLNNATKLMYRRIKFHKENNTKWLIINTNNMN